MILALEYTWTEVPDFVPNFTDTTPVKLAPVIVTVFPPRWVPLVGDTELMMGSRPMLAWPAAVAEAPPASGRRRRYGGGSGGRRRAGTGQAGTAVPLAIQEAVIARHVLVLDYRDRRDVVTVREVEPVAFAGTRNQWYLLAWCRLRDSGRAFRVDRILAVADTGEPAPRRSYRDVEVDIPDALVRRPDLAG